MCDSRVITPHLALIIAEIMSGIGQGDMSDRFHLSVCTQWINPFIPSAQHFDVPGVLFLTYIWRLEYCIQTRKI